MLLSAALIARDEAHALEACLASIRDLVDEIVLADTGSCDGTPEIARRFGARVFDCAWRADFAAARNAALERARGAWILYIDADERVSAGDRDRLEPLLRDPDILACTVRFRPQRGYTRYHEYRLFRNDPALRFRGVIHETVLPDLKAAVAERGGRIADSALAIDHAGYDGDQEAKHRRNLPLLRARLDSEPDHVYSGSHLGRVLAALGDEAGATAVWERALAAAAAKPEPPPGDCLPYVHLLQQAAREGAGTGPLLDEALRRFPDNHLFAWFRGRSLMDSGAFEEAIAVFDGLAAIDPEEVCDARIAYDARIFREFAYASLALCCFRLGRFAESARYYALAETCRPGALEYTVKRWLAEARVEAS